MLEKTCYEFTQLLATSSPVPGGGSACAYVGALGMALGSMVGNLTTGKKKYESVEKDIKALIVDSNQLIDRFNHLVDADIKAFSVLAEAYGLPARDAEEMIYKEKVMQPALAAAALVPLDIAQCAVEAITLLKEYAYKGSRLAVSDAGTGAVFCKAALQGAKLNVLINLKLMKDEKLKSELSIRLNEIETKGIKMADEIYAYVVGELA